MSQTEVPSIRANEANDHPGDEHSVGRQTGTAGFWGSMPRVLTALAGLVTAVGTAAAVYFGGITGDDSRPAPTPVGPGTQVLILPERPAPAPVVDAAVISRSSRTSGVLSSRETVSSSSDADDVLANWENTLDAHTAATAEGCAYGDSESCGELLEILASTCRDGDPHSCDVLFLASPSGSALEEYGNSCGGRIRNNEEWCSDLVGG
jgi:hypothetical protein